MENLIRLLDSERKDFLTQFLLLAVVGTISSQNPSHAKVLAEVISNLSAAYLAYYPNEEIPSDELVEFVQEIREILLRRTVK